MKKPTPPSPGGEPPLTFRPCRCGQPSLCDDMRSALEQLCGRAITMPWSGECRVPGLADVFVYGEAREALRDVLLDDLCERAGEWLRAQHEGKNRKAAERVLRWKRERTGR